MAWSRLLSDYVTGPEDFWPRGIANRQALKLVQRRDKLLKVSRLPLEETLGELVALVLLRRTARRPTVYLSNVGGSGSHWVQAMLAESGGLLPCGEVYLPPAVLKRLAPLPLPGRAAFVDAVHLVHAVTLDRDVLTWNAINTNHNSAPPSLEPFLGPEPGALTVLLVRDPVDIVLSRVFRKEAWRQQAPPGTEDAGFLLQNISHVTTFYEAALARPIDLMVRYEDLRADPGTGLRRMLELAGVARTDEQIAAAVARHSAEHIASGQSTSALNLYRGPRTEVPEDVRTRVEIAVALIRERLGYASDQA